MKRFHLLFLLSVGFLLGSQLAMASTVEVGTCRKGLTQFATISAAVAAVPSGSTVLVCPGTYPEQVVISTPLTLEGISNGNSGRVIIAFPSAGLGMTVTSVIGAGVVGPQVLVTTGPVNITNITVDGTGNNLNGTGERLAGILYESGASGTVNGVTAREQNGCGCGTGIWAENGNSTSDAVTIENSQVHDADLYGMVLASSINPPTLVATVKGNQVINSNKGILSGFLDGTIASNSIIDHTGVGISANDTSASIISNTIAAIHGSAAVKGIVVNGKDFVKSNIIIDENGSLTSIGIDLSGSSGATVEANKVTDSAIGIEFGCKTGNTVSGNTLIDVGVGLDKVPTGLSVPGTIQSVDNIRTGGC